jgi:hypothetical protein
MKNAILDGLKDSGSRVPGVAEIVSLLYKGRHKLMKTARIVKFSLTAAILGMVFVSPAAAETVSYTVGGWGPQQFPAPTPPPDYCPWGSDGYPGDTVELEEYTGTLELAPGTYVLKINTLLWTIDYTYGGTETDCDDWSDVFFTLDVARSIEVGGESGALTQSGSLQCTWENDFLAFAEGPTTVLTVGEYEVNVTPLLFGPQEGVFDKCDFPCAQPPYDLWARFVVEGGPASAQAASWGTVKAYYR